MNDLKGDAPQERIDAVKTAWMRRYGTSEQEWIQFKPQTKPKNVDTMTEPDDLAVDVIATPEELSFRYKSRAKFHLSMARKQGNNPNGLKHFRDGVFYAGISKLFMTEHVRNSMKIKGF